MRASEEQRKELLGEEENPKLEKGDFLALWTSGMVTIALPCLLLILLIVGVTMLLFGR